MLQLLFHSSCLLQTESGVVELRSSSEQFFLQPVDSFLCFTEVYSLTSHIRFVVCQLNSRSSQLLLQLLRYPLSDFQLAPCLSEVLFNRRRLFLPSGLFMFFPFQCFANLFIHLS
ncbi:unnamed protein product [Haemonchus placei]|uniref:Secreted protein n=1 Tax=Haemonchus placei TaxID=6290 RepID=A0A0N4VU34_HAEPC|nr:unnamed protein product [Haemonchus placei]